MATAGHCLETNTACENLTVVFDLINNSQLDYEKIPEQNVYKCTKILKQDDGRHIDFAIFKLDRPVSDRSALPMNLSREISTEDHLTMIGYPFGLPIKVNQNIKVLEVHRDSFLTNSDSYIGNSGSSIINQKTYEVEGILVGGAKDFVLDKKRQCFKTHVCPDELNDNECEGETVTKIKNVLQW